MRREKVAIKIASEAGFHPPPRAALPSLLARYPLKKAERKTDGWIGEPDRSPPTRTMTIFQRRISKSTNNKITLDWTAIEKEKKRETLKALIQLHLLRSFNFLKIDRITLARTIWSQVYRSSFIVAMSSDSVNLSSSIPRTSSALVCFPLFLCLERALCSRLRPVVSPSLFLERRISPDVVSSYVPNRNIVHITSLE